MPNSLGAAGEEESRSTSRDRIARTNSHPVETSKNETRGQNLKANNNKNNNAIGRSHTWNHPSKEEKEDDEGRLISHSASSRSSDPPSSSSTNNKSHKGHKNNSYDSKYGENSVSRETTESVHNQQILINSDSNSLQLTSEKGLTPLITAIIHGATHTVIEAMLLGNKESINTPSKTGEHSPLMFACKANKYEIVDVLIIRGANIHSIDKKGKTALFYAVESANSTTNTTNTANMAIIKRLLDAGADVAQVSYDNKTCFDFAGNNQEIKDLLNAAAAKQRSCRVCEGDCILL